MQNSHVFENPHVVYVKYSSKDGCIMLTQQMGNKDIPCLYCLEHWEYYQIKKF